jgi:hypothetical protein
LRVAAKAGCRNPDRAATFLAIIERQSAGHEGRFKPSRNKLTTARTYVCQPRPHCSPAPSPEGPIP